MSTFNVPGPDDVILNTDRKILWLASYPKSGNTWVRMFLNCYATRFPLQMNTAYQFVVGDLKPEVYQMMSPRPLDELTFTEQFMYHQGALLNLIKLTNTQNVCVKTHNAKAVIEGTVVIPPRISGHSVYLIRDPRDVVLSMAAHFNTTLDQAIIDLNNEGRAGLAAFNLHHMFMSWSNNVDSWTKNNKDVPTMIFRYEDLLKTPVKAFTAIVEQLGFNVPDHEERLKFALEQTTFDNLQAMEKEEGFIEKRGGGAFFRVGKAGQWKTKLTKSQLDAIEGPNKEVMKTYGYL
jgi:hypothetical protein